MKPLTDFETQVLSHLARGYTRDRIADILGINQTTLGRYIKRIHVKTGAANTVHAVALRMNGGQFSPEQSAADLINGAKSVILGLRVAVPSGDEDKSINSALEYAAYMVGNLLNETHGDKS